MRTVVTGRTSGGCDSGVIHVGRLEQVEVLVAGIALQCRCRHVRAVLYQTTTRTGMTGVAAAGCVGWMNIGGRLPRCGIQVAGVASRCRGNVGGRFAQTFSSRGQVSTVMTTGAD